MERSLFDVGLGDRSLYYQVVLLNLINNHSFNVGNDSFDFYNHSLCFSDDS